MASIFFFLDLLSYTHKTWDLKKSYLVFRLAIGGRLIFKAQQRLLINDGKEATLSLLYCVLRTLSSNMSRTSSYFSSSSRAYDVFFEFDEQPAVINSFVLNTPVKSRETKL